MAIPIIDNWQRYFDDPHEGLGSSYERIVLNLKLMEICQRFGISSVIETPSFGFTGLSGINSMQMAIDGKAVTLEDHDFQRIELIRKTWSELKYPLNINLNTDYSKLPYPDDGFDLAWNFSALWFVKDLSQFLSELSRITKSAILICVPNTDGFGYKMQMKQISPKQRQMIHPENIKPERIIGNMIKLKWSLCEFEYIDCPPWFDIGTSKEEFLARLLPWKKKAENSDPNVLSKQALQPQRKQPVSILNLYNGSNPEFSGQMLRYSWFEKTAPNWIKKYWAHHRYLLFCKRHL